ncbi:MAG: hypothetical protein AUJ57_08955 [Zetaproteobacteria bacterium CG1_02_53_45]|nr:MAG: hypothetical protein AUJ57_08955 [Zetaproteobacteria bacterium CG1_02_53_45]
MASAHTIALKTISPKTTSNNSNSWHTCLRKEEFGYPESQIYRIVDVDELQLARRVRATDGPNQKKAPRRGEVLK